MRRPLGNSDRRMGAMNLLTPTNGRQHLGADAVPDILRDAGGTDLSVPAGAVPDILRDAGAPSLAPVEATLLGLTPLQLGLVALAVWFVATRR